VSPKGKPHQVPHHHKPHQVPHHHKPQVHHHHKPQVHHHHKPQVHHHHKPQVPQVHPDQQVLHPHLLRLHLLQSRDKLLLKLKFHQVASQSPWLGSI